MIYKSYCLEIFFKQLADATFTSYNISASVVLKIPKICKEFILLSSLIGLYMITKSPR